MRVILQSARRALGALSSPPLPLWAPGSQEESVQQDFISLLWIHIFHAMLLVFIRVARLGKDGRNFFSTYNCVSRTVDFSTPASEHIDRNKESVL